MTDYLEQFFALGAQQEEEPGMALVRGVASAEEPAALPVERSTEVPEPKDSTSPERNVELFQTQVIQRLEQTLTMPEPDRPGVPISRPAGEPEGADLERRLRRDSRRYDSGFYWA